MIAIWVLSIEPLIGGLRRPDEHEKVISNSHYWTPYRGIEMLIRFPWKGSGGGVVYGFGVWRVKSWVKNVLNTNKYIAISPIKWGWSPLTYLPLVVIIFKKSIILFYWTPYRGIDTFWDTSILNCYSAIEPLIGGLIHNFLKTKSSSNQIIWLEAIEPLIGGLRRWFSEPTVLACCLLNPL